MKRACLTTPRSQEPNGEYTQPDETTCAPNGTNNDDAPSHGWIMSQTLEIVNFKQIPRLWNLRVVHAYRIYLLDPLGDIRSRSEGEHALLGYSRESTSSS